MYARIILTGALLAVSGARAEADVIAYVNPHPVAPTIHRGMCYIEGPHVHVYKPHKPILYVKAAAGWSFVGDPIEFDHETPRHAYYGHHPVFWVEGGAHGDLEVEPYCFITGPHYHWYVPPARLKFKKKGGAYWYIGGHPGWYHKRRHRHRHIDDYYSAITIEHPQVVVEPPSGFVGVVVGPAGGHVRGHVHGGVHIVPPRVQVTVPVPSLDIFIGGGSPGPHRVIVPRDRRHRHPPHHAPAWGKRGHRGGKGKGKGR